jgi:hypothetical protein
MRKMKTKEALKVCKRETPNDDSIYRTGWTDAIRALERNPKTEYQLPEYYARADEGIADCIAYFNDLLKGEPK